MRAASLQMWRQHRHDAETGCDGGSFGPTKPLMRYALLEVSLVLTSNMDGSRGTSICLGAIVRTGCLALAQTLPRIGVPRTDLGHWADKCVPALMSYCHRLQKSVSD